MKVIIEKPQDQFALSYMAEKKSIFAVTLGEALIYEYETKRQTTICYISRGETIQDNRVFVEGECFSNSFMLVGIISELGTVPLLRVPVRVKITTMSTNGCPILNAAFIKLKFFKVIRIRFL